MVIAWILIKRNKIPCTSCFPIQPDSSSAWCWLLVRFRFPSFPTVLTDRVVPAGPAVGECQQDSGPPTDQNSFSPGACAPAYKAEQILSNFLSPAAKSAKRPIATKKIITIDKKICLIGQYKIETNFKKLYTRTIKKVQHTPLTSFRRA